jgi:hypothetical protein
MAKTILIKPLDGFSGVSDADVIVRCNTIQTNIDGNSYFAVPPVDPATLKKEIDKFSALVTQAHDGSKKAIAEKNKQREVVIKMVRLRGYLQRRHGDLSNQRIPTGFDDQDILRAVVGKDPQDRAWSQQRTNSRLGPENFQGLEL